MAESHRETQKRKWADALQYITTSNAFQDVWKRLNLTKYRIIPMEQRHFHEALNIMAYQFSSAGGTMSRTVVQHTVMECYNIYKVELAHSLQTGLNFVIVDERNSVCALSFGFDVTDMPPKIESYITGDLMYLKEAINMKSELYQKYMGDVSGYKFGELFYGGTTAVRPDKIRLKLGNITTELYTVLTIATGYRMIQVAVSHPVTIKIARTMMEKGLYYADIDLVDFSDITLTNGQHVSHYYDRLRTERGFSPEKIRKLKSNSVWGLTFTHWDRVLFQSEDPYEQAIEEWKKRVNIFFNRKKKAKL